MLRVRCLQGLLSLIPDSVDCGENNKGQLSFLGEVDANAPDPWVQGWLEKSNAVVLPSVTPEYRRMYLRCGGRGRLHGQTLRQTWLYTSHSPAKRGTGSLHPLSMEMGQSPLLGTLQGRDFPSIMVTLPFGQSAGRWFWPVSESKRKAVSESCCLFPGTFQMQASQSSLFDLNLHLPRGK